MFWKKKEDTVTYDGLPVTLSKRDAFSLDIFGNKNVYKIFLAYKHNNEWRGLVGYEEYKHKTDLLEKKLNLIIEKLGVEYIPETEKKEPAKLVEKKVKLDYSNLGNFDALVEIINKPEIAIQPKSKRKYTKRKKK